MYNIATFILFVIVAVSLYKTFIMFKNRNKKENENS